MAKPQAQTELEKREAAKDKEKAEAAAAKLAAEAAAAEALDILRKDVKAHVTSVLGTCNAFAKGLINGYPEPVLRVVLTLTEREQLIGMFGQAAVDVAFCNVRHAASVETQRQGKKLDDAAKAEASKHLNVAKLALADALNEKGTKLQHVAGDVIAQVAAFCKTWPGERDQKTFGIDSESIRSGDYVLTFSATVKRSPEKKD